MRTLPIDQVEGRLAEVIEALPPSEEVFITRDDRPVARLVGEAGDPPPTHPGAGEGDADGDLRG